LLLEEALVPAALKVRMSEALARLVEEAP